MFSGEDQAIGAVLGLLFVSLAVIGTVAVLLGAGLVAARRDAEFAVLRARGASLRQVAGRALAASAALALPAGGGRRRAGDRGDARRRRGHRLVARRVRARRGAGRVAAVRGRPAARAAAEGSAPGVLRHLAPGRAEPPWPGAW